MSAAFAHEFEEDMEATAKDVRDAHSAASSCLQTIFGFSFESRSLTRPKWHLLAAFGKCGKMIENSNVTHSEGIFHSPSDRWQRR